MMAVFTKSFVVALLIGLISAPAAAQFARSAPEPDRRERAPAPSVSTIPRTGDPFLGSVTEPEAGTGELPLSIEDAIARGLERNLGVLLSEEGERGARGARWQALGDLLPRLTSRVTATQQQVNLEAFGFGGFPGMPTVVGPFGVVDARVHLSQPIVDIEALASLKAQSARVEAARFVTSDARDLVVLVVSTLYLQVATGVSRVEAARAEVDTATALQRLATDLKDAGLVAGLDVLRAEVQLERERQRLLTVQNDLARARLQLARAIGVPLGRSILTTDTLPYRPLPPTGADEALQRAFESRGDYQAAQSTLKAVEFERRAARADAWPSLHLSADYGDIGPSFADSHGTFNVTVAGRIPIFDGSIQRGRQLQAEAALRRERAHVDDLKGRIEFEVRTALLDLAASDERVRVAERTRDLAGRQLQQSRDRLAAGVTDNLEVVQSQESLAEANESYLASLLVFNVSKLTLARAMGLADTDYRAFLGATP
ncbi:MAG: TolC family protein [Vicinamibacterales bacterium]